MATMNNRKKGTPLKEDVNVTRNHEGSKVHNLNSLEVLFSKVLGSFFGESTFYEQRTAESDFIDLVKTINSVDYEDREYVLKIALLAREYNMIQYPLAVLTACFNDERFKGEQFLNNGQNKLQYYSNRIVRRGKDITDVLAMQITAFGFESSFDKRKHKNKRDLPLPVQLRKALKFKLETFNEYQLSKALGDSKDVSMADCIKLLHPNESKAKVREGFYRDIIEGKVLMGDTSKQVQSELAKSKNKNSDSTLKDVKESIDTSTVMAIVKNLVALERAGALKDQAVVETIYSKLTDAKQIRGSRLLPFRFYSALKEVSNNLPVYFGTRKISEALVRALDLSIDNLDNISGYSAILIDRSGSMQKPISSMSSVNADDIAAILGAICFKKGIGDIYLFASESKRLNGVTSASTVIDIANAIKREYLGGGTYLDRALNLVSISGAKYDNLIILSDNDCYTSRTPKEFVLGPRGFYHSNNYSWDSLINNMIRNKTIKKVYLNNLLGNNFAIVNTDDYRKNLITGFSERIVETINVYNTIGSGASDVRVVIDSMVRNLQKM